MELKTVREYIFAAFRKSGLTERELSRRMKISPSYLNGIMSGERRWNEEWMDKFCQALGVNPSRVFSSLRSREPEYRPAHKELHDWLEWILTRGTEDQKLTLTGGLKALIQAIYMDSGTTPEGFLSKKAGRKKAG